MSKYTTEVRFICETLAGYDMSQGYGNVDKIINDSWAKIFNFDFPIFDEAYRQVLCKKILMHYYTREIGFETVGLWKLKLQTLLNEIMPYYNKLYQTETLEFNPLYDVNYTKTHAGEDNGSSEDSVDKSSTITEEGSHTGTIGDAGTHTGNIKDAGTHGGTVGDSYSKEGNVDDTTHNENSKTTWDVFSDTPQGALTNVANNTYLTNARKIDETGESDGTDNKDYDESGTSTRTYNETNGNTRTFNENTGNTRTFNESNDNDRVVSENTSAEKAFNTTSEYTEHVMGKTAGKSYSSLIVEYRESLLNIDMMIIKELKPLFMMVW